MSAKRKKDDEEASEENYFELVEYLRFATLNVYMDSQASAETAEQDSNDAPLH